MADGPKWLHTPCNCGYIIVRFADAHRRAMRINASYLPVFGNDRGPSPLSDMAVGDWRRNYRSRCTERGRRDRVGVALGQGRAE